jgi:transposase
MLAMHSSGRYASHHHRRTGRRHTQASALRAAQDGGAMLADKAYDSTALRPAIAGMSAEAAVPSNRRRKAAIPHDVITYRHRNRIERCFSKLMHFRRSATSDDKRTIHFAGLVISPPQ